MPGGTNWTEPETLAAFRLYCSTPFGRLHQRNPDIIELAEKLGRTPSAVGMKACNFASLDPAHQARGVTGLPNRSKVEEAIWERFMADSAAVALEAEAAWEAIMGTGVPGAAGEAASDSPAAHATVDRDRIGPQGVLPMPQAIQRVGIRPGVNILGVLRHLEYKPWYALAEYVDNAVQSYMQSKQRLGAGSKLVVGIEIDRASKTIVIYDNAGGIRAEEIPRAFRPAEPPQNGAGLSEFGMGMKSASCWFSPLWEVHTSAVGEPVERRVRFDIDKIIEDRIDELEVDTRSCDSAVHFTRITLREVYQIPQGRTLGKIRDHLTDIYRCFIRDGVLELRVPGASSGSDEVLSFEEPDSLVAPRYTVENEPEGERKQWRKSLAFELNDGRVVCGEAGILTRGDTRRAGLCLFRRNRAIVGTGEDKYRPPEIFGSGNTYESQRVWGELHMDDFEVSHTKDGFRWGDSEDEFLDKLRKALDEEPLPLLKQARNYRSGRPVGPDTSVATSAAVSGVITALTNHGGADLSRVGSATAPAPQPPPQLPESGSPAVEHREFVIQAIGGEWYVTVELSSTQGATDWLEIACDQNQALRTRRVGLRVNMASPFMRRIVRLDHRESLEPVLRLAAAFGLAEVLARFSGGSSGPGELRRNANELLRSSLSR